jgi:hypothetical protein
LADTLAATRDSGLPVATPMDAAAEAHGAESGINNDASVDAGPFAMAPHPAWPQVPGSAMVVLRPMNLVTVVSTGDPNATDLFGFADALIASQWWQTIGKDYDLGVPSQSVHVLGPAITANPTSGDMTAYIASAIAGESAAAANGETMYVLYLPEGVDIVDATMGVNSNCEYYSGYHAQYDDSGDAWGVVQHCPVAGSGVTDFEWTTIIGSHEIAEGASDPIPGSGWALPPVDPQAPWSQVPWILAVGGEIADMCNYTQTAEGGYTYQRIWSNTAAGLGADPCVPAYPQYAYCNASAPLGWYPISSGGSVTIPMTGFSDRATSDWTVEATVWSSSGPSFEVSTTSPTSMLRGGTTYPTTNNGRSFTVTVTAPSTATAGSGVMIGVYSEPFTPSGDPYHLWFVGAYVQ